MIKTKKRVTFITLIILILMLFINLSINAFYTANREEYGIENGKSIISLQTVFSSNLNLSNADISFIGESPGDYSGYSITGAGDVNGDGYDDILIGSYHGLDDKGQTYLIFGKQSGWESKVNLSNSNASFIGEFEYDYSGYSIAGAGDVNDDGFDDILIGAYGNDDGGSRAGKTYLILGKASGWEMGFNLSNSNASFIGEAKDDWSGNALTGAGDINNDSFADFLIGAKYNKDGGDDAGKTYLIFGRASGWLRKSKLSNSEISFIGETAGDQSGQSIAGVGDINNDTFTDILIGAPQNDDGGSNAGKIYMFFGIENTDNYDNKVSGNNGYPFFIAVIISLIVLVIAILAILSGLMIRKKVILKEKILKIESNKMNSHLSQHKLSIPSTLSDKSKKRKVQEKEFSKEFNLEEREDLKKTESEVNVDKQSFICVVHKGPIVGSVYICPQCQTFYCQTCVNALKKTNEKCWSCGKEFD